MNSRYNKSFEENLRRRLEQEELGFDEKAWEMMESKMDDTVTPWYKSKGFILGSSLVALIFMAGLGWNLFSTHIDAESKIQQKAVSEIQIDENLSEEKATDIGLEEKDVVMNNSIVSDSTSELINTESVINKKQKLAPIANNLQQKKAKNSDANTALNSARSTQANNEFVFNYKKNSDIQLDENSNLTFSQTKIYDKIYTGDIINKKKKAKKETGLIDEKKNYIKSFSLLPMKSSKIEDREWMIDDPQMIDIEEHIDVPQHLINLTFGGGMANLDFDDPSFGDLKPLSAINRESYFSLSYLRKAFNNFGIEAGLQVQLFQYRMTKSLEEGTYNLDRDYHLTKSINYGNVKVEPFVNFHFFQKINRRLDLDIYAGYYAMNLPSGIEQNGYSGGSSGKIEDTWLLSHRLNYGGSGRLKLGANFNILTTKLNTIGLGIAYSHNLYGTPQGTYALFQSADNSLAGGNYRANGNGFKIQLTYGFGLDKDRLELRYMDKKKVFGEKNFFASFHFGIRSSSPNTILNDCFTGDCVNFYSRNSEYLDFTLGHYISEKWALGLGLGFQNVRHFVPFDMEHELYYDLQVINVPLFAQYDFYTKNKINLYTQIGPSFDFKLANNITYTGFESYVPRTAEEDKLQVNLRVGLGLDFKIAKGLSIGADVKSQFAFDNVFVIEKEVAYNDDRILRLAIRNTYVMGGLNLKYLFTN